MTAWNPPHPAAGGNPAAFPPAIPGDAAPRDRFRIPGFRLLLILVFMALVVPPLVPASSIRLDTMAIFVLLPALVLRTGRIAYDRRYRPVLLGFATLAAGVGTALLLQVMLLDIPMLWPYLQNFQGYSRPTLFGILAAMMIRSRDEAETVAKLILAGTAVHGFLAAVEYANLQPFTGILGLLYRGSADARVGTRAIGAFTTVHGLAYFSLYGLVFSTFVLLIAEKGSALGRWARLGILGALAGIVLPFSRGAWIAAAAGAAYMLLRRKTLPLVLKAAAGGTALFAIALSLFPESLVNVVAYYSSIVDGARFLLGAAEGIDEKQVSFITARLDWGWMHALEVWRSSPVFGDMSFSMTRFIGDGGYTETLANHGLLGMGALLLMLLVFWFGASRHAHGDSAVLVRRILRTFVVVFFLASFATGTLKERSIELLPVMLIVLTALAAGGRERAG